VQEAIHSLESDAFSDTSCTPPKLEKQVKFDEQGQRHVLAPPESRNAAPKKEGRFTFNDWHGRKYLIGPPGFRGVLPRRLDEPPVDAPVLSFDKKKGFKKLGQKIGELSKAIMRQNLSRAEETNSQRTEMYESEELLSPPFLPHCQTLI
jgi:hypothetical protein